MKQRITSLILALFVLGSLVILGSCGGGSLPTPPNGGETGDNDNLFAVVYAAYTAYADENGEEPLSYEEWLESIRGAAGANGLTPHIGENGKWWIGETDTGYNAIGADGKPGADGITPTFKLEGAELFISYNNGDSWTKLGSLGSSLEGPQGPSGADGEDGKDGADGITPEFKLEDGKLYVTYDKGETWTSLGTVAGADGEDGEDGADGKPGAGIENINCSQTEDGEVMVTITFTDGTSTVFFIPAGQEGKPGEDGEDGEDGVTPTLKLEDGYLYVSYDNGESWECLGYVNGEDGKPGEDGVDGAPGADGKPGEDGKPGADGVGIKDIKTELVVRGDDTYLVFTYYMTDGSTIVNEVLFGTNTPDVPSCNHRDADDNGLCDICGNDYDDGPETVEVYVKDATISSDYLTLPQYGMGMDTTVADYLYRQGLYITLYWSDGRVETVHPGDATVVSGGDIDLNVCGKYSITLSFTPVNSGTFYFTFTVEVTSSAVVDPENNVYAFDDPYGVFRSITVDRAALEATLHMIAGEDDMEMTAPYVDCGDHIEIDMGNCTFTFILNSDTMTAYFYDPDYGNTYEYLYESNDGYIRLTVLGDYVGAGYYFALHEADMSGIHGYCSIKVYYDRDAGVINCGEDALFYVTEDGYHLSTSKPGAEITVVKAWLVNPVIKVPQYAEFGSLAELLNAYGMQVAYQYSDGSISYGSITDEMVTIGNVDTSVAQTYVFRVDIYTEAGTFYGSASVEIYSTDVPGGTLYYNTANVDFFTSFGIDQIVLYSDNYLAFLCGGEQMGDRYYYQRPYSDVILFDFMGQIPMLLNLYDDMSVEMYHPMGDVMVLGSYYMIGYGPEGEEVRSDFTVLDWYINGQNVALCYGPCGSNTIVYCDMTTLVVLDLNAGTLSYAGMTLYIGEDGSLSTEQGGEDTDLEQYKMNAIEQMQDRFNEYYNNYGEKFYEMAIGHLNAHIDMIKAANETYEIEMYYREFTCRLDEIVEEMFAAGSDVYVTDWYISNYDLEVYEGTSFSEVINIITSEYYITFEYSDGTSKIVSITEDMLNTSELPEVLVEVGSSYYVSVSYNDDHGGYGTGVNVKVVPNMSEAALLYTLTLPEGYVDRIMEMTSLELYDNGYAIMYYTDGTSETLSYTLEDDLLSIGMDGAYAYFVVDFETDTMVKYHDAYELGIIGKYTFNEQLHLIVLGEYNGAGEYFVKYGGPVDSYKDENGNMQYVIDYVTTIMYVDLEARTIEFYPMGTFYIMADDTLARGISAEERQQMLDEMQNLWNELLSEGYELSAYQARFDELYTAMSEAYLYNDANNIYSSFRNLVDEVRNQGKDFVYGYLAMIDEEWRAFVEKYGYEFEEKYSYIYHDYYDRVKSAYSEDEADMFYREFMIRLREAINEFEGNVTVPSVNYVELSSYDTLKIGQGQSAYDVICKIMANYQLRVCYSDGSIEYVNITEDMINTFDMPEILNNIDEYYNVEIRYIAEDGCEYGNCVDVRVTVNMDAANYVTTYKAASEADMFQGAESVDLYDNGFVYVNTDNDYEIICAYRFENGVLVVSIEGIDAYFSVDDATGTFAVYIPDNAVIGEYVLCPELMGVELNLVVYGNADSYGDVFVYNYAHNEYTSADGSYVVYDVRVTVKLPYDPEQMTLYFPEYLYAPEAGYLELGADGYAHMILTDEYRAELMEQMASYWNNRTNGYDVTEYQTMFEELHAALSVATYYHEVKEIETELDKIIEEIRAQGRIDFDASVYLNEIDDMWKHYSSSYDKTFYEVYVDMYREFRNMISEASDDSEAKAYLEEFHNIMEDAVNSFGGETEVHINYVELSSNNTYKVPAGATREEVVEYILNNYYFIVYYSNGETEEVYVSVDMIDCGNLPAVLETVGDYYYVDMYYENSEFGYSASRGVDVRVTVNMDGAVMLDTFNMATVDYCFGITYVETFDNGYAAVWTEWDDECEYVLYAISEDGILVLNLDGVDVYYQVNYDNYTFDQYLPADSYLGEYVHEDELEIKVFGEYTGAGRYFVSYGGIMDDDKNEDGTVTYYYDYVTIMMTVDLEAGTITFDEMEETLYIREDGTLATLLSEESRESMLSSMAYNWSNVKLNYTITDEQHALYDEFYNAILEAVYYEDADAIRDEFNDFVNEIRNSGNMGGVQLPIAPDDNTTGDYVVNGDYAITTDGENSYATYVPAA